MAEDFNRLPQLLQALHAGAVVGIRKATETVSKDAAGWAPVDTGFLKASCYYVTSDNSTYGRASSKSSRTDEFKGLLPEVEPPGSDLEGIVAVGAAYGTYVEHGTSRMAAQPFLTPAAEAMRGKLPGIMASEMGKAIKKIVK